MKKIMRYASIVFAFLATTTAFAAGLPCEELKAKIAKKIEDKGVKNYQLNVVDKNLETTNRIVGTCEGGSKKITYERVKQMAP